MLIESVSLPYIQEEDYLLLPTTGAYYLPMTSNYNLVLRPAVILLAEEGIYMMERRETIYKDIVACYPIMEL
jgi:diaminopimelate decarboxylase